MTNAECVNLLAPLAAACSGELDKYRIMAFHAALGDLPVLAVKAAVTAYLMTAEDRWWPMPGTIRRMALQQSDGRHLTADEAWSLIETASRTWTRHDEDRAKAATANMPDDVCEVFKAVGYFTSLQEGSPDSISVMRSNFLRLWRERTERVETERATPEPLRPRIATAPNPAARIVADSMRLPATADGHE